MSRGRFVNKTLVAGSSPARHAPFFPMDMSKLRRLAVILDKAESTEKTDPDQSAVSIG